MLNKTIFFCFSMQLKATQALEEAQEMADEEEDVLVEQVQLHPALACHQHISALGTHTMTHTQAPHAHSHAMINAHEHARTKARTHRDARRTKARMHKSTLERYPWGEHKTILLESKYRY